jgi:hypothetical protein
MEVNCERCTLSQPAQNRRCEACDSRLPGHPALPGYESSEDDAADYLPAIGALALDKGPPVISPLGVPVTGLGSSEAPSSAASADKYKGSSWIDAPAHKAALSFQACLQLNSVSPNFAHVNMGCWAQSHDVDGNRDVPLTDNVLETKWSSTPTGKIYEVFFPQPRLINCLVIRLYVADARTYICHVFESSADFGRTWQAIAAPNSRRRGTFVERFVPRVITNVRIGGHNTVNQFMHLVRFQAFFDDIAQKEERHFVNEIGRSFNEAALCRILFQMFRLLPEVYSERESARAEQGLKLD